MLMRKQPNAKAGEVVGALDIGTSKVCCLIAASDGKGGHRLLGFGHQRMRGIKAGVVVDPEKVERARTVFEWGPATRPGGKGKHEAGTKSRSGRTKENHT